jgi:hypothetical protein
MNGRIGTILVNHINFKKYSLANNRGISTRNANLNFQKKNLTAKICIILEK